MENPKTLAILVRRHRTKTNKQKPQHSRVTLNKKINKE